MTIKPEDAPQFHNIHQEVPTEGVGQEETFAIDADDPRRAQRQGEPIPAPDGLVEGETPPPARGPADEGMIGEIDASDETGALNSGERGGGSGEGQLDLNTTGAVMTDRGPVGAGPTERDEPPGRRAE